jgi:hypothetical protein
MKKVWVTPVIEKLSFAKTESGPFGGHAEVIFYTAYKTGS